MRRLGWAFVIGWLLGRTFERAMIRRAYIREAEAAVGYFKGMTGAGDPIIAGLGIDPEGWRDER